MAGRSLQQHSLLLASSLALALQGCGGGGSTADQPPSVTASLGDTIVAVPTYRLAPVLPAAPADTDIQGGDASALQAPERIQTSAAQGALNTAGVSAGNLPAYLAGANNAGADNGATKAVFTIYTPAQIRAAYGFIAIPAVGAKLTAAQKANLGSGQTIYIIDAYNAPTVAADLATFNTKFGLPACTTTTLKSTSALPLAANPAGSGCSLTIAYANASGGLNNTAPANNAGWAGEIALDVQWAHALAPMARIVLIEGQDAMVSSLSGAVALANKMGKGAVSMSFGAPEGAWVNSYDGNFNTAGMSYIAASGDNGAGVSWPAVSSKVLATGGTSLSYTSGTRAETAWSGSGGGTSAYVTMPLYQTYVTVPGKNVAKPMRAVPDVALNSDPNSGVYTVMSGGWYSVGGTSAASPQWASLLAVTNALRAQSGKTAIGQPQTALYKNIAAVAKV
ncbi:MAG: S53 family peptidase, partial [Iodobacter sp.]